MRKILFKSIALIAGILFAVALFAQGDTTAVTLVTNPFDGGIEDALGLYDIIFVALVNIWGYVSRTFFKKEPGDPNFLLSLGAGVAIIGGIFYWSGIAGGLELVVQFVLATKLYDFILKPAEQKAAKLKEAK